MRMGRVLGYVWKRIGACFLAGLFAVLPLVVTVGIVIWVASFVQQFIGPETVLGKQLLNLGIRVAGEHADTTAYVLGWIVVLLTIFGLGVLLELGAKRFFSQLMERMIHRIPLINSVYATSKQMVDMLNKEGSDAQIKGMSPVMCHFGDDGGPAVLALLASAERYLVGSEEYQIVIIPTAPVPFGGALLLMPAKQVKPVDMPVDGLMNIYVSMGITAPKFLPVKGT
ncbi:MAG: hypothetical protein B7Z55_02740 [Planctomycetales bacterium 12-60-4]|nr:MAG: hypothetical protein B7Z55_02740 [Planctomycetales bacterium 12-60-4]